MHSPNETARWQNECDKNNKNYRFNPPVVNFINIFCVRFSYKRRFGSFFLVTFWQKKHFRQKKAHKKRWWNWALLCCHIQIQYSLFLNLSLWVEVNEWHFPLLGLNKRKTVKFIFGSFVTSISRLFSGLKGNKTYFVVFSQNVRLSEMKKRSERLTNTKYFLRPEKSSICDFFAFTLFQFWENAWNVWSLIRKFSFIYFPRFRYHLKNIKINKKVNKINFICPLFPIFDQKKVCWHFLKL